MIFVGASLLISEKVGYGWRDQEVTLREEKVSEERETESRKADRALDEVPPFKDKIIGDLEETRPGKRSSSKAFRWRSKLFTPPR